eukprot:10309309-Lingulodinium_polyedra.AAC.1
MAQSPPCRGQTCLRGRQPTKRLHSACASCVARCSPRHAPAEGYAAQPLSRSRRCCPRWRCWD